MDSTSPEKVYDELPVTPSKDIAVGEIVGSGSYGTVQLCKKKVICKLMHGASLRQKQLLIKEARIMQKYKHINIVEFDSLYKSNVENEIGFLMEYVYFEFTHLEQKLNGSSLSDLLSCLDTFSCKGYEHFQMVIAKDITRGLSYLHENNVVHRDLKSDNVLISNQHYSNSEMNKYWMMKPVVAKIADFGESRSSVIQTMTSNQTEKTSWILRGTAAFLAPEAFTDHKKEFGIPELKKVDTWALLMIFNVLINPDKQYPFQEAILKFYEQGMKNVIDIMKAIFQKPLALENSKKYIALRLAEWKIILDIINNGTSTSSRPSSGDILIELEKDVNSGRSQFEEIDSMKKIVPLKKKIAWSNSFSYDNPLSWKDWHEPNARKFLKDQCHEKPEAEIPDETELKQQLPVHQIDDDGKEKLKNPEDSIQFMWIGHATFIVQFDGLTVLADPVFLKCCSPSHLVGPIRYRPTPCEIEDLPKIDAVIVSHNHYDHLENEAVKKLNSRFPDLKWYVPEGTGSWFKGYNCQNFKEMTWWDEDVVRIGGKQVKFCCVPAQHWSKRSNIDLMQSLWCGWVIKGKHTFYYSGDTGYCPVFKTIGEEYGPMDLSAIPIGCYSPRQFMKLQYINPEEAVTVHIEVRSKYSVGIHWGTFDRLGSTEFYLEPKTRLETEVNRAKQKHENFGEFITVEHGRITGIPIKSNGDKQ